MDTIKVLTHIDDSGTLRLELPTRLANADVEVLIVLQPTRTQQSDTSEWPSNYFEAIDSITADDLIVRPEQGVFESREPIE